MHFLDAQMTFFEKSTMQREDIFINKLRVELENLVQILEELKKNAFITSKVKELMIDQTEYVQLTFKKR